MKYAPVNAFLSGVRPCVVAMILATALSMALSTLFGLTDLPVSYTHLDVYKRQGKIPVEEWQSSYFSDREI